MSPESAALHGKQRFDAALLLFRANQQQAGWGATDRQYETVSKTVGGGDVARGFESLPLRFWLGRAKFAADTRVSTLGATSRDRSSGVNVRQRTSTTASATGFCSPRLDPVGGASTARVVALLRCKFLPALRARRPARWLSLAEADQQSSCYWRWAGSGYPGRESSFRSEARPPLGSVSGYAGRRFTQRGGKAAQRPTRPDGACRRARDGAGPALGRDANRQPGPDT